jgi:hypothetical protein
VHAGGADRGDGDIDAGVVEDDSALARDQRGAMPPTGSSPSVASQKKPGSMWWWVSTVKVTVASGGQLA